MTVESEVQQKRKQCKDCVNFVMCREDNKVECDFDYFEPIMYEDAVLYVPELFDCDKYEDINLL